MNGIASPIHKKGSKGNADNYWGIMVSSCLGKVFGIEMNNRLKSLRETHSPIDERQSSHHKNSRTTDNIFIIQSLFEKYCLKESMHTLLILERPSTESDMRSCF